MVWGQAGVAGHLKVGDDAQVAAHAVVTKDVEPGCFVVGYPATSRREAMLPQMFAKQAPRMKRSLAELEARIAAMEKKLGEGD
jgi:UDP-3-O-[3-hydroxymyristoyl] glucosamine N-acyltransferase